MFVIEKNVPIPSGAGKDGRLSKYPFGLMEVGDSFLAPEEQRNAVRSMATYHTRKTKQQFVVRKAEDGKVRCWRVS